MDVLFFLVFPISTIIIAIVLQKIIKCPLLVAAFIFAIFLIVTYTAYDTSFLINTIIYTILAYIAAFLSKLICCLIRELGNDTDTGAAEDSNDSNNNCNCSCNNNNDDCSNILGNSCFCNRLRRRF